MSCFRLVASGGRSIFENRILWTSECAVTRLFSILVIFSLIVYGQGDSSHRESRKLFGGYRITPSYCKATRASRYNKGNTICMFNHECAKRGGEVVGACMDGFLFGACCQLPSENQIHFPKGPGVVMTSYLDYPEEGEEQMDEGDDLAAWHESFKPSITPGYRPPSKQNPYRPTESYNAIDFDNEVRTTDQDITSPSVPGTTQNINAEIISDGLSQITNTLLNTPDDSNIVIMKPSTNENDVYSHSTISHEGAETILVSKNGSEADNVVRPSDFTIGTSLPVDIQISSMQTKPTSAPTTSTTVQQTISTHKPIFLKPVFKPKPAKVTPKPVTKPQTKATSKPQAKPSTKPTSTKTSPNKFTTKVTVTKSPATTEKYATTQDLYKISSLSSVEVPSIGSILQMLNESTPPIQRVTTESNTGLKSPSPQAQTGTVSPVTYSSGYPSYYLSTSQQITLRPSTFTQNTVPVRISSPSSTYVPEKDFVTKRPAYIYNKYTSPNTIPEDDKLTTISYVTSIKPIYHSTIWPSTYDDDKFTTVSYVSSEKPTTLNQPPSTSYISGSSKPPKRPSTAIPNIPTYDIAPENFASVTPTVIVLNSFQTPKPETTTQDPILDFYNETNYVEISQEPFKKPVSQVTINNIISSTHNIHVNKKPEVSSPTVVITPKPSATTQKPSTSTAGTTKRPVTKPSKPVTTPDRPVTTQTKPIKTPSKPISTPSRPITTPSRPVTTPSRPGTSPNRVTTPGRPISNKPVTTLKPIPRPVTTPKPVTTPIFFQSSTFTIYNTSDMPIVYTSNYQTTYKPESYTSPDDLINFPPVRNPWLNATGSNVFNTSITFAEDADDILQGVEFTTPSFLQEDEVLHDKMNLFVNKIVGSLQGTFQELHDIVILDKQPNSTKPAVTQKPTRKPTSTKRPLTTSKRPPVRATTTTRRPVTTTRKPARATTTTRKPTTIAPFQTTTKKTATTPKKKKVTTTTQAATTTTEQYEEETTEPYLDSSVNYKDKNLCGVRPLVKSGRIVGGKGATFGEWPWQVLVRESTWLGLFTKNKCGGVLITSKYVTTAAHCQPGFLASLVAVFGELDISGDTEARRPVSRNVRQVIVHRQYDAATFENDLAVLELESPVQFDAHIVPICMPPDGEEYTGRMATVTGWGRLKYGGGVPAILQEVQVPVLENSVCQEMFQAAKHTKIILNSFLCAGYANGQKDSCEGDSGGPLVVQREDGRWQLIGTVSHGIKCAAPFLPGVYMRTSYYKPWLKSITSVKG